MLAKCGYIWYIYVCVCLKMTNRNIINVSKKSCYIKYMNMEYSYIESLIFGMLVGDDL